MTKEQIRTEALRLERKAVKMIASGELSEFFAKGYLRDAVNQMVTKYNKETRRSKGE